MDDLEAIMHSFRELKREFHRILSQDAERVGVTTPQLMVLSMLNKHSAITLGELSDKLNLSSSTMSGVVDRLTKANLIERDRSQHDRRALTLKVTPEGRAKLDEALGSDSMFAKCRGRILGLSAEDLDNLLRIHSDLLRQMQSKEEEETQ